MNASENSPQDRSVLVVDDDPEILKVLGDRLEFSGYRVELAPSAQEALERASDLEFDVVLTDVQMPGMDGFQLLGELKRLWPDTPVVLMTGFGSIRSAVEAIHAGALDYIAKPFSSDELLLTLERACERRDLESENKMLRRAVGHISSFGELVGKSVAMNEIYALIRKIASNRSNVLITGESGTGKDLVARAIHFGGPRRDRPYVPINCTAMPEGLLESELFGHVRGAFTGAHTSKKGLFEVAQGGTLFLDEVGDMHSALQGKLLRVLQDREIRPVGANHSIKVDTRIIAATNQDIAEQINDGYFRKDLYYRLNVIPIHIPPLRERPEDIPILAEAFLRKHADDERYRFTQAALRKLKESPWLGNARELENCVERALALSESTEIDARDILLSANDSRSSEGSLRDLLMRAAIGQALTLKELSESYVDAALEASGGSKSQAARLLDVNRRTLYRRAERLATEGAPS